MADETLAGVKVDCTPAFLVQPKLLRKIVGLVEQSLAAPRR
jgi:hypothetical protein